MGNLRQSRHSLSTITGNTAGKVRREMMNGRDYLVAPLTLIVPGVLNGSKGALYYPPDEVARDPSIWNGMPLVIYHPTATDGTPISGRDPKVIERQGVGYVYGATYQGKLQAEGWFDIEHTRRISPNTLSSLQAGKPIELSTGLFTDNYPGQGVHNSPSGPRPYDYTARNYRPDHVAILPNQVGACSIRDGCGVLVNVDGKPLVNGRCSPDEDCECQDEEDRRDCEEGTFNMESTFFQRFWDWVTNAHPNQPRSSVTGRLKRLSAGVGKGEAHEAAQSGFIALSDDDKAMGADACRQLKEGGHNPASWVEDEGTWEKAKAAATKGGYDEGSDQYWAVVTHIYKNMGGTVKESEKSSSTDNSESQGGDMAWTLNLDTDLLTNSELGVNKEFETDEERRAAFASMADAGGGGGADKPVSTREMKAQGGAGPRASTGRSGPESHSGKGGTQSHSGKAGPSASSGGGKSALHAAAKEASAAAVQRSALAKKAGGDSARKAREHRKAWTAHLEAATAHENAGNQEMAGHHLKAADEHLAKAKHHEGTNNLAINLDVDDRDILIERLVTTNCACQGDRGNLALLSDTTLEGIYMGTRRGRLATNAPEMGAMMKKGTEDPMGGQGGHDDSLETSDPEDAVDQGTDEDMEDEQGNPLPQKQGMPTKGVKAVGGGYGGTGNVRTMTVNQWMESAPPEIRSAVHNAMEIEKAERIRLVRALVANVQDPARQKALAASLLKKDLGDLRERLELMGTTIAPQQVVHTTPLFNGAAGAPSYVGGGATTNQGVDDDDVLPLPTINWADERDTGHSNQRSMREAE